MVDTDARPGSDALFEVTGGSLMPTELARGPWDAAALHGGPTAALVAREVERHLRAAGDPPGPHWQIARMTVELLRPVPVAPIRLSAETIRPGRKVTVVAVSVAAGEREVARAVVLGIRSAPVTLPRDLSAWAGPTGGPETLRHGGAPTGAGLWRGFHNGAVDMAWVSGGWEEPGPVSVWMRLRVPVVAGEETTPAMRAAALADFGNGVSWEVPFTDWRFVNPELTVHLARQPEGEWLRLDARSVFGPTGAGMAESQLSDRAGVFGRSAQALLIEPV